MLRRPLAKSGLRYNRFHVNSLCSPTRATLLSGRNDHQIGFGMAVEAASGFLSYNSVWPKSAASIAELLKDNGYSAAAFGNGTTRRCGKPMQPAGSGHIEALGFGGETLDIGSDLGSPVTPAYRSPFAFTGTVRQVTVDLK